MNTFQEDFLSLINEEHAEEDVDILIEKFMSKHPGYNIQDLMDLYVNCLWSEIDNTNEENLINDFLKEHI